MLRAVISAAVLLATALPASSGGSAGTVDVIDDDFLPSTLPVRTGRTVTWTWIGTMSQHNVREDHRIFRSGAPTAADGTMFRRVFSAGTFHYYCALHGSRVGGMAGLIRARLIHRTTTAGDPLLRWASPDSNTGRAFDVQFRVGNGPWRIWRKDTTKRSGVFGRNGRPVPFDPDRSYSIRARSQHRPGTGERVSRWSPIARLGGATTPFSG
jgi:plastocyanin